MPLFCFLTHLSSSCTCAFLNTLKLRSILLRSLDDNPSIYKIFPPFGNLTLVSSNPWQCAFDRAAVSDCYMGDDLMDGCSRARPVYMCSGADAAQERFEGTQLLPNCRDQLGNPRRCMGTEEGNSSVCLQSTLFLETFSRQSQTAVVGCYRARCLKRPSPLLPPPCPGTHSQK